MKSGGGGARKEREAYAQEEGHDSKRGTNKSKKKTSPETSKGVEEPIKMEGRAGRNKEGTTREHDLMGGNQIRRERSFTPSSKRERKGHKRAKKASPLVCQGKGKKLMGKR